MHARNLVALLTQRLQRLFGTRDGGLLANFETRLRRSAHVMPRHRVLALPGDYQKVVSRATVSGMIRWSRISDEPPSVTTRSSALTMSSFAVVKDEDADRLISWPRIQNLFFLPPDAVDLPDPSLFERVSLRGDLRAVGFGADVAEMFHNIVLPPWLSDLLPLAPVVFVDLSGEAQRTLCKQL